MKNINHNPRKYPRYDPDCNYSKTLYNARYFIDSDDDSYQKVFFLEQDEKNSYIANSNGFRSTEFSSEVELLAGGCSNTYGSGVPMEGTWWSLLSKKMNLPAASVATTGASISLIVDRLFSFFDLYGHPKVVVCLFPDLARLDIPVDGNVLTSEGNGEIGTREKNRAWKKYLYVAHLESNQPNLIKRPFNAQDSTNIDSAVYRNIKSIRMLERYCTAANIKLSWSSWDFETSELIKDLNEDEKTKFSYFFDIKDQGACIQKNNDAPDRDLIFQTAEDAYKYMHEPEDQGFLPLDDCHQELLEMYGENFYKGLDYNLGQMKRHPGVHAHAHYADAFYSTLC